MKTLFSFLFFIFLLGQNYAQSTDAPYRIFGEISTVDNKTHRGFISWGIAKNYWIDFFEASKTQNVYSSYFHAGDGITFQNNGRTFAKPPVHIFTCRFGNISSIRLLGEQKILLQLKNGEELYLVKGHATDINTSLQISISGQTIPIKWEFISEIRFMAADSNAIAPNVNQAAAIVKSTQGIYKGLITWNYNQKRSREKNNEINIFLNKMDRIYLFQNRQLTNSYDLNALKKNPESPFYIKPDILYPMENVMVNMPNVGSVTVPMRQFKELKIIPLTELSLLSYDDFHPRNITGEVITRNNVSVQGKLAYDLDENLNAEALDGKNGNITYRIPFTYINTIEPKNYKYSFITLRNGNQLSLGDEPDVNQENSGIIVFTSDDIPTYIPWEEIKTIIIRE